ncbi:MAG TPA: hypothetical protein DCE39_06305 [Planctomycetaceae bacterium]|nr:hypothetical protein [Planctomycetaceae bacterium]|tara:strand:- start:3320 stop:5200 length:1881 start_codon:yes stop_codon:yes gene_type:complete
MGITVMWRQVSERVVVGLVLLLVTVMFSEAPAADPARRFEFTRLVAHWHRYDHPDYLPFLREARPDVVQLGFYGAHFWSLVHTKAYGGYPAHFPVRGHDACGKWFAERNRLIHEIDARVVGHFNVEFLVGDPRDRKTGKEPTGFFRFYEELWDEKQLGPRPVKDPLEFLERGPDGKPISQKGYGIGGMREYWACLRNPGWQKVLKAWVRHGIRQGLDGFIANYFYRHNCLCDHCQKGFRKYLADRFSQEQLKRLGIDDVAGHRFDEIVSWHDPATSTPLRREMLRWSQISNKQVFDEVFHRYGRSLKPDLVTAQWNHLGNFGQISGDERCLLPGELWGRDETYLWYSTGAAAFFTDLKKRFLGEGTLQARYIRGAFDDKPFTLGKYESTRIRVAIAELAANGGAPMGFYTRFTDSAARGEIVRYYRFLGQHDALFRGNRSHAETVLLFPRQDVRRGRVESVEAFKRLGRKLLDDHVLFDVLPDDLAASTPERLTPYGRVLRVGGELSMPDTKPSRFEAPYTVRVSASRPAGGNELDLHLVNYNRIEPPRGGDGKPSAGGGLKDEKPIAVAGVKADVLLPVGLQVGRVEILVPERKEPVAVKFQRTGNRVQFEVPEFLVYCVIRLRP